MSPIESAVTVFKAISMRCREQARPDFECLNDHELADIGLRPYVLAGSNRPARKIEPCSPHQLRTSKLSSF